MKKYLSFKTTRDILGKILKNKKNMKILNMYNKVFTCNTNYVKIHNNCIYTFYRNNNRLIKLVRIFIQVSID